MSANMAAITQALIGQDASKELSEECSAHLDSLTALGNAKAQFYTERIKEGLLGAAQGIDMTFPVTTIQSFIYQVKAYTANNAGNITDTVNNSIKDFVSGDNTSAVTTIVSGFVNLLFGGAEGSESEIIRYSAILEGVSMIRLDFAGWSREVKSNALKSRCDKVSAFVLYRSIVDMSKVKLNDFVSVYQWTVKAQNPGMGPQDVIKACKELYSAFNTDMTPRGGLSALIAMPAGPDEQFVPSKGYETTDIFRRNLVSL